MKRSIIMLFSLYMLISNPGLLNADDNIKHRIGYAMGKLDELLVLDDETGSREASILLGRNSTGLFETIKPTNRLIGSMEINPFRAIMEPILLGIFKPFFNRYVWVKYEYFSADTQKGAEIMISEIERINYMLPKKNSYFSLLFKEFGQTNKKPFKTFDLNARIVKVSQRDDLLKSWEVIIQVGNFNDFRSMSIVDSGLAEYAIDCLKSGRPVKLTLTDVEIGHQSYFYTGYFISKIEH